MENIVKKFRQLHDRKGRSEEGLLLLEGSNLLEAAWQNDRPLLIVCYTQLWQERYPQLWPIIQQRADRVQLVSEKTLKAMVTTVNPDGVVAISPRLPTHPITPPQTGLGLVLDRLQDPGNLGTIIRTAVATEVEELWLSGDSVDVDHPKVLRSSVGAWFRAPLKLSHNLTQVLQEGRDRGYQIVATSPQAPLTYWEVDWCKPTLIVLGNEGAGLASELVNLAHHQVKIPLASGVESLNVAIAAALLLYEAQRQRQKQN